MREIKFRAWDRGRNIMIGSDYPKNWGNNSDEWYFDVACMQLTGIEDISKDPDHIVMQYIGLKDKNGVGIYEGDIIKYDFNKLNYRIEFVNAEFIARRFYENIENLYPSEFDYGKECEVIGNIYENPELLQGN